jgi:hypothetical protein
VNILPEEVAAAGVKWKVDNGEWQNSGATVRELFIGKHALSFTELEDWNTPVNTVATVLMNQTVTLTATYTKIIYKGSLTVMLEPEDANAAGAQWRVGSGAWQDSGDTVKNIPVGTQTVLFRDLAGWTEPMPQSVEITRNETTEATFQYTKLTHTSTLTVTVSPPEAVTAGAQWRVNNASAWKNSGDTITGLPAGSYTISFNEVSWWTKPCDQVVVTEAGQTTLTTGTYAAVVMEGENEGEGEGEDQPAPFTCHFFQNQDKQASRPHYLGDLFLAALSLITLALYVPFQRR